MRSMNHMIKAIQIAYLYLIVSFIVFGCSSEKPIIQTVHLQSSLGKDVNLTGSSVLLLESFDDVRSTSKTIKRVISLKDNTLAFEIPVSTDLCHLGIQIHGYKPQIYNCEYFKHKKNLEVYPLPSVKDEFWPNHSIGVSICGGIIKKTRSDGFNGTGLSSEDFWAEVDETGKLLFKSKVPINNYTDDRLQQLYYFKYKYAPSKEPIFFNHFDSGEFVFVYKKHFFKIIPAGSVIENKDGCKIYNLLFDIEGSEDAEFYSDGYNIRFEKFFDFPQHK